jgi:hypothetical protein
VVSILQVFQTTYCMHFDIVSSTSATCPAHFILLAFRYDEGELQICWRSIRGQPTRGDPPPLGLGEGLIIPHRIIPASCEIRGCTLKYATAAFYHIIFIIHIHSHIRRYITDVVERTLLNKLIKSTVLEKWIDTCEISHCKSKRHRGFEKEVRLTDLEA